MEKRENSIFIKLMRENQAVSEKIVECFTNGNPVYFYGCGNQGLVCEEILVNFMKLPVQGFVVSDENVEKYRCYSTMPIYSVLELENKKEKCNVLITTGEASAQVIEKGLEARDFKNIYHIADWESTNMILRELVFDYILEKHGAHLDREEDVFTYGSYKFINPFKEKHNFLTMFLGEFNSLVAPHVFKDFDFLQVEGPYEYKDVKLEKDDVVLDCGANIGLFSSAAASLGCKVYAFEPVRFIADYLQRTAELYEDRQIEVENVAVSDHCGETAFMQVEEGFHVLGWSTAVLRSDAEKNTVLPTITIDDFVEKQNLSRVDFIKSDIEGAERDMLRGAAQTLKKFAPKLAICTYHLPDDKEVLTAIIKEANPDYIIEYQWEKLFAYVPKKEGK